MMTPRARAEIFVRHLSSSTLSSSLSSSSAAATRCPRSAYQKLEQQFQRHIAPVVIEDLLQSVTATPVLCIGGDQSTGKSTLSNHLARRYHATVHSAGQSFRALARSMGMTPAQLSVRAMDDPSIDVKIEYALCRMIAAGTDAPTGANDRPLVIEGRQPGVMARYVRSLTGKPNMFSIFLRCSIREQALRFIERVAGTDAALQASRILPADAASLSSLSAIIEARLYSPQSKRICELFRDNDRRDENDRLRYQSLYGDHPCLDYRNTDLYDVVLETSANSKEQTLEQIIELLTTTGIDAAMTMHN